MTSARNAVIAAFAIERQFGIDDFIKALAVGDQILHAVAGPFDRAVKPPRHGADKNLLRIERALAAETAADIAGDDANAVARKIERVGQRIAHDAGHLGGGIKRQRLAAGVVFGEAGARLDRDRRLAMHAETAFDAHRRGGKRGIDIAALEFAADQHIGAGLLVQQRRAGTRRLFRIDDHRQQLVIDGDEFQRILGLIAVLRHDADDRFADIADLAARQRQDRRRVIVFHARGGDQRLDVAPDRRR